MSALERHSRSEWAAAVRAVYIPIIPIPLVEVEVEVIPEFSAAAQH
jgi:hypothetical protein